MTIKSNKKYFKVKSGLWKGYQLWDLYDKNSTPRCIGMINCLNMQDLLKLKYLAIPFDESAVDFLKN